MIHYDEYANVPREVIDAFVREQELGRLVTVSPAGEPHLGLYPFAYDGSAVEVHLNRADAQLADLAAGSRCVFEVDEPLAIIPSYWVHPESAVMATAYHRTVIFECTATVSDDAATLVAQQTRLLARYQPEGGFRPVAADDALYRGAVGVIAAVHLAVTGLQVKFKLGQNRPAAARARVVEELRRRGRPNDARAAAAVAWTIDRERG